MTQKPEVTVEFCFVKDDEITEVHYRRIKGTPECDDLINQYEHIMANNPGKYFYQEAPKPSTFLENLQ